MRGTPSCCTGNMVTMGIIPAYAGNTKSEPTRIIPSRDHPRVCGEHGFQVLFAGFDQGSSPRMRGTLRLVAHPAHDGGIIPAYAGNT